jgi:hypothetical protein
MLATSNKPAWRNGYRYPIAGWDIAVFSLFENGELNFKGLEGKVTAIRYWVKNWRERELLAVAGPKRVRLGFEPLATACRTVVDEFPHPELVLPNPTDLAALAGLPFYRCGFERFTYPSESANRHFTMQRLRKVGWLDHRRHSNGLGDIPQSIRSLLECYKALHRVPPPFESLGMCIHQRGSEAAWTADPQSGRDFAYFGPRSLSVFDVWALRGRAEARLWYNEPAKGSPPFRFIEEAKGMVNPSVFRDSRFQALLRGYQLEAWMPGLVEACTTRGKLAPPPSFSTGCFRSRQMRLELKWY